MTQPEPAPEPAPKVLQCADTESSLYGAVAVRLPVPIGGNDWGVMTLTNGGHYAIDDQVKEWVPMKPEEVTNDEPGQANSDPADQLAG